MVNDFNEFLLYFPSSSSSTRIPDAGRTRSRRESRSTVEHEVLIERFKQETVTNRSYFGRWQMLDDAGTQ